MKDRTNTKVLSISGKWIAYAHTVSAYSAFLAALVVGSYLHYHKIVQNEHYGYPDEWFPSVSATIGDRYPERSIYQILIALTAGPRFLLLGLTYLLTAREGSSKPLIALIVGVVRSITCGGWTYITSTDDHDWHDIFMIAYMVLTIPWTVLRTQLTPANTPARKWRVRLAVAFFATIVPLVYFFIQHKVHKIAGAYTIYAFLEWALILLDVGFDTVSIIDLGGVSITINESGVASATAAEKTEKTVKADVKAGDRTGVPVLTFVVAVINYFVFWSVFTSFGVLIWYFPLWYMGISGYEALLVAILAPALLVGPLRKLFVGYPQLAWLGTALGVAAYLVPKPSDRVQVVAAGCGFGAIALAVQTYAAASKPAGWATANAAAFVVGLMLSAVAKMYLWTNNPIWSVMNETNGGLNKWGLGLAITGALLAGAGTRRFASTAPAAGSPSGCAVKAGLGVGGLVFAMQTYLSDTSLLPLWVWEGYPVRGPTPLPHGFVTLVVMGAGLYIGVTRKRAVLGTSPLLAVNLAAAVLYLFKHWIGYAGGLVVAAYLCAVAPAILETAGRYSPYKVFGIAMLIEMLLILAETWTVAYAFVPGGPALRERTWVVMAINQLLLSVGVLNARKVNREKATSAVLAATRRVARFVLIAITAALALGGLVTLQRLQHVVPAPVHPEEKLMTAGIWTVHFGLDNDMWASEVRMRDLLRDAEVDVVGLLESDTQRVIGGHRDMTQRIAEELGYYADYGPGPNKHTWGAALLSRFPILKSTHHLLPSPVGELAPAIHATLDVYGHPVDVVVFHSGQEEDVEDRRLQTAGVSTIMRLAENPTILLSYLVTKPHEGNYNTYVSEYSGMHDIDPTDDWDRWCEYILYKGLKRTGYARISRSTITDTELQVGKFVVGEAPNYSNERVDEADVAVGRRFPQMFRGDGVRGHRYHVFDEPRYYT